MNKSYQYGRVCFAGKELVVRNIYWDKRAAIGTEKDIIKCQEIKHGVIQIFVISRPLFLIQQHLYMHCIYCHPF